MLKKEGLLVSLCAASSCAYMQIYVSVWQTKKNHVTFVLPITQLRTQYS